MATINKNEDFGYLIIFYSITQFFLSVAAEVFTILLIYISHYSIAYYIKLLAARLTPNNSGNLTEPFWNSKKILLHLHRAYAALGSVFSIPVLYIITMQLTMTSVTLFLVIYSFIKPNPFLSSMTSVLLVNSIKTSLIVFTVLHSADIPVNQVLC